MKSKTLQLIEKYHRLIREQGEDQMSMEDPNAQQAPPEAAQAQPAAPEEEMPLTSQGENEYIKMLVDAALFSPSPEEAKTLANLQSVMALKRFKNAREEVLPMVLTIINSSTSGGTLKQQLNDLPE